MHTETCPNLVILLQASLKITVLHVRELALARPGENTEYTAGKQEQR